MSEKIRVLLVDDHTLFRSGIKSLLQRNEDFEVVGEAGDGLEGIKRVRSLKPDVTLLDLHMPGVSGLEAVKVIAEEITARVAQDKAYQNAQANSDKQNAKLEHDKALNRVVLELLSDHTELFKQFSDNPSFKHWLTGVVFDATYQSPTALPAQHHAGS